MEETLENKRKRLIFRSWHRGTREIDLLLGKFADSHLAEFSEGQLDLYDELLKNSDPDIFNWVSEKRAYTGKCRERCFVNDDRVFLKKIKKINLAF